MSILYIDILQNKIPILRQNIILFIKLTKVLEVANFRFLTIYQKEEGTCVHFIYRYTTECHSQTAPPE